MKKLFNEKSNWLKTAIVVPTIISLAFSLASCKSASETASNNLKNAAENFELEREVVFYNALTDHYFATLKGRCNIEIDVPKDKVDVTCKHGPKDIRNHYLGRAAGVTYFVLQTAPANVSEHHTRITFNPQGFIPDIDFRGSAGELLNPTRPDTHNEPIPKQKDPITTNEGSTDIDKKKAMILLQTQAPS